MLKNTKVVGIAAAITLLTGVALAPSASAVNGNVPDQSAGGTYTAGARVTYTVTDVRTGCDVTTTLGSQKKTEKAKHDKSYAANVVGKVNSFLKAPKAAGEYTISSMVSTSCASDAGFKRAYDMSDDVTVGAERYWDETDTSDLGGDSMTLTGAIETLADGSGVGVNIGATKVLFSVRGKVVASSTATDAGVVSVVIDGKYMESRGATRVRVSLSDNKLFYVSGTSSIEPN